MRRDKRPPPVGSAKPPVALSSRVAALLGDIPAAFPQGGVPDVPPHGRRSLSTATAQAWGHALDSAEQRLAAMHPSRRSSEPGQASVTSALPSPRPSTAVGAQQLGSGSPLRVPSSSPARALPPLHRLAKVSPFKVVGSQPGSPGSPGKERRLRRSMRQKPRPSLSGRPVHGGCEADAGAAEALAAAIMCEKQEDESTRELASAPTHPLVPRSLHLELLSLLRRQRDYVGVRKQAHHRNLFKLQRRMFKLQAQWVELPASTVSGSARRRLRLQLQLGIVPPPLPAGQPAQQPAQQQQQEQQQEGSNEGQSQAAPTGRQVGTPGPPGHSRLAPSAIPRLALEPAPANSLVTQVTLSLSAEAVAQLAPRAGSGGAPAPDAGFFLPSLGWQGGRGSPPATPKLTGGSGSGHPAAGHGSSLPPLPAKRPGLPSSLTPLPGAAGRSPALERLKLAQKQAPLPARRRTTNSCSYDSELRLLGGPASSPPHPSLLRWEASAGGPEGSPSSTVSSMTSTQQQQQQQFSGQRLGAEASAPALGSEDSGAGRAAALLALKLRRRTVQVGDPLVAGGGESRPITAPTGYGARFT